MMDSVYLDGGTFSSKGNTSSSLPAMTITSMLSEPTNPQRIPYQLPFTQSSHTWRIRTATSESSLLTSPQHPTQFSPMKLIWKLNTLGDLSATLCNWILDVLTSRAQRVTPPPRQNIIGTYLPSIHPPVLCTKIIFFPWSSPHQKELNKNPFRNINLIL